MGDTPEQAIGRPTALSPERQSGVVTLLFTDVVGSTALKQQLGDKAGLDLLQRHHELLRKAHSRFAGAREINTAGDSFFVSFPTPSAAVSFALLLQTWLRSFNVGCTTPVQDRVGIHLGEVTLEGGDQAMDLLGLSVDLCARVMSLAQGGQILMTRPVFDNARQSLKGEEIEGVGTLNWLNHGRFEVKGVEEPVEICEVRSTGAPNLSPPTTSEKARHVESTEGETVLGWRPAVGQVVPNTQWILQEKLGEGGFGEVWLGQHQVMKERRVFKFCFRADRVRSLKREMTLFRLIKERIGDHPNIVALREVYFEQPPFYVEEDYFGGTDLLSWCATHGGADKVPLETKLEIVAQLADALQGAHDAGVIHRDVKPANILVGSQSSDSQPSTLNSQLTVKLTDFGIGQVVSAEYLAGVTKAGFTQTMIGSTSTGTGTTMYLAPEIIAGMPATIRSDIYSLGVVFYQLLSNDLTRPVTTDWTEDISDPLLKEDLHHCFAREPGNRFAGAAQFARNLRSLPQRQAERAAREQVEHHAARRRVLARAAVVGGSALLLLAAALGYGLHRAQHEAVNARRLAYASDIGMAWRALKDQNLGEVRALLAAQVPQPGQVDARGWEWRYLWQASRGAQLWTAGPMPGHVLGLGWLPGGRLVAGCKGSAAVTVWDSGTQELLQTCSLASSAVSGLAVSPDNQSIAVAEWSTLVRIVSAESLQVVAELRHEAPIVRVSFSPDSRLLSCLGPEGVVVWEVANRRKLWAANEVSGANTDAPFSADGHFVFYQMPRGDLGWYGATNGAPVGRIALKPGEGLVSLSAFAGDAKKAAAADLSGRVYFIDLNDPATKVLTNRTGAVNALALAPDGRTMATGSADAVITIWDLESGTETLSLRGHGSEVLSLLYAPDGQTLFSGGRDGTVRAWDMRRTQEPEPPLLPVGSSSLLVTRNGRFVALYYPDPPRWSVLDLEKRRESPRSLFLPEYLALGTSASICPCGHEVAGGMRDGRLRIWRDGKLDPTALQAHSNSVAAIEFSHDCERLATLSAEGELRVWERPWFRLVLTRALGQPGRINAVREAAFSPDGGILAVAAYDIHIIRLRGGADGWLPGGGYVASVALSHDGSLVAGGLNAEIPVWDLRSLRLVQRLQGGRGYFNCVSFSPDNQRVLATDASGTTWLWDLATGRNVGRFEPRGRSASARFQDDGETIVLHSGGLFMPSAMVELMWAPSWAHIQAMEITEAKTRRLWIRE